MTGRTHDRPPHAPARRTAGTADGFSRSGTRHHPGPASSRTRLGAPAGASAPAHGLASASGGRRPGAISEPSRVVGHTSAMTTTVTWADPPPASSY